MVVGPDIYRRRVEKHHTYDTQAAPPQPIKLRGVVKPEVYAPPTT